MQIKRLNSITKTAQEVRKSALKNAKPTTAAAFALQLHQRQKRREEMNNKKNPVNASARTEEAFQLEGTWFEAADHVAHPIPSAEPECPQASQVSESPHRSLRSGWAQIPSDSRHEVSGQGRKPERPQVSSKSTERSERVKAMRMLGVAWKKSSVERVGEHLSKIAKEKELVPDSQRKLHINMDHLLGLHHDTQAINAGREALQKTMADTATKLRRRRRCQKLRRIDQMDVSYILRSRGYGSPLVNVISADEVEDDQAWPQLDQPMSKDARNWEMHGRKMIAGKGALIYPGMSSDRSGIEAPPKVEHIDW